MGMGGRRLPLNGTTAGVPSLGGEATEIEQIIDFVITFSKFTVDGPCMALTANLLYL